MARAAPQLNVYSVGFSLQVLVVLVGGLFLMPEMVRAMNAVTLAMGLKCDRSEAFQKRQNDLREFVIRHWNGGI